MRRALAGPPPSTPPPAPMIALAVSPWHALSIKTRQRAPWWVLLLSGLAIGGAFSLLLRFLKWRRSARAAAQRARELALQMVDPEKERLTHVLSALRGSAAEAREQTAFLRRQAEQQERLHQMSTSEFRRSSDEFTRRRQRMEIGSESWKLLKSLVRPDADQVEAAWFQNVTEALDELSAASAQNRAAFRRSMQTLALMLQNLLAQPQKYGEVNAGSARFQEIFTAPRAAAKLLQLAGFEEQEELFNFTASSTGRAERLWEVLQHALRES
ncbi:unnamed protein product [Durusdinium trenchii]|uniref:Uncharacterized protein n=1 Tax=Durusdinium trenchii TaxID=1381693 RepID=A0ABP0S750_9DINO